MTWTEWFNSPYPYLYLIGILLVGFWAWIKENR